MATENNARSDTAKRDRRVVKTHNALYNVLLNMLGNRNFNEITVNDLCAEAIISRATFYAHFNDKYSLLKYFLMEIRENIIKDVCNYEELEREINGFVELNKKVITNIIKYASGETLMLVREFMSGIVELTVKREVDNETCAHHVILFNFVVGGLVNLLTWLVENNFPPEIKIMNTYLYRMLGEMTTWDAQQESG